MTLRSKGKMEGSAASLLASYVLQHGRSRTVAFERAMRAEARQESQEGIEDILSQAESAGMMKPMLLDYAVEELSRRGNLRLAQRYFSELTPSQKRLDLLFRAALKRKNVETALHILKEMDQEGFSVDQSHLERLLQVSVRREGPWRAERRHFKYMKERRWATCSIVPVISCHNVFAGMIERVNAFRAVMIQTPYFRYIYNRFQ